jgi:hypothetical protein
MNLEYLELRTFCGVYRLRHIDILLYEDEDSQLIQIQESDQVENLSCEVPPFYYSSERLEKREAEYGKLRRSVPNSQSFPPKIPRIKISHIGCHRS